MFQQLKKTVKSLFAAIQAETPCLKVNPDTGGPSRSLNTDGKEAILLCAVPDEEGALGLRLQLLVGSTDGQRPPVEATGIQQAAGSGDAAEIGLRAEGSEVSGALCLHSAGPARALEASCLRAIPCRRVKKPSWVCSKCIIC